MSTYRHSIADAFHCAQVQAGISGWTAYAWESLPGGYIVTGCVPAGTYTGGPRKGTPRFSDPRATHRMRLVVTSEALAAAAEVYERAGRCWDCKGEGKVAVGWNHVDGTRYAPCQRCQATGRAQG